MAVVAGLFLVAKDRGVRGDMRASRIRQCVVAVAVALFIHGRFSASADYDLLRQCYDLAASQEVAKGCSEILDAIDGYLRLMLVGFMLVEILAPIRRQHGSPAQHRPAGWGATKQSQCVLLGCSVTRLLLIER